ncbi:MAG: hypothetical protein LBV29_09120 [Azoarcus sp.]|jgi:type IV pilus biogenesis protein PilP|nr:hypothetical protein [Azoarcus sp.]
MNIFRFSFVLALAAVQPLAFAVGNAEIDAPGPATPAAPTSLPTGSKSGTKLELDAIRTQAALVAERVKTLNIPGGQPAVGPMVPAIAAQPIAIAPGGRGSSNAGAAQVTMVAGREGQLFATIQTARGLVVAKVGDKLPDLGVIRSIAVNQVIVEDGKKTHSLPFAFEPASALIQGGMAQGSGWSTFSCQVFRRRSGSKTIP